VARFDPSPNAPQDGDILSPGLLTRFSTGAFLLPQVSLPFVLEGGMSRRGSKSMAYQDNEIIRNPDDPYDREWGTGSIITVVVAIVIMAGIVAYSSRTATNTEGASSSISQPTTTG
jgi:hypothetical protein